MFSLAFGPLQWISIFAILGRHSELRCVLLCALMQMQMLMQPKSFECREFSCLPLVLEL